MTSVDLKQLTSRFTLEQLESCIQEQVSRGTNSCGLVDSDDEVFAALSKAEVLRELMDQGLNFSDALRELGKRIRSVYGKD